MARRFSHEWNAGGAGRGLQIRQWKLFDKSRAAAVFRSEFFPSAVTGITGTSAGTLPLSGAALAAILIAGQIAGALPLAGTAVATHVISGQVSGSLPLSGSASATHVVLGQVSGNLPLSGSALAQHVALAQVSGSLPLSGSSLGRVFIAGDGAGTLPLSGASLAQLLVIGQVGGIFGLSGVAEVLIPAAPPVVDLLPNYDPPVDVGASAIVAQAFRFVQTAPIGFFENDTEQRVTAAEAWTDAHDACLLNCDWSFASAIVALSLSDLQAGQRADADLPYFYKLPGDVIQLREVGLQGVTRWRIDTEGLRSDQAAPLRVRYTSRVTDPALLPASYRLAVALHMAVRLAPRWIGRTANMYALEGSANKALMRARLADARTANAAPAVVKDTLWADDADDLDWASEATA